MRLGRILGFVLWMLVLGAGFTFFYDQYQDRQREKRLRQEIANLTTEIRYARILCTGVSEDPKSRRPVTDILLAETDASGKPLAKVPVRPLRVPGRDLYFDSYQIIFDTEAVREGDPLRNKALTLFCRVFSEEIAPKDGIPLDVPKGVFSHLVSPEAPGVPPVCLPEDAPGDTKNAHPGYVPPYFGRVSDDATRYQTELWSEFWRLAKDQDLQRKHRIRTVQGKAVHRILEPGKEYRIQLTNTGDINFDGPFEPDPFLRLTPP